MSTVLGWRHVVHWEPVTVWPQVVPWNRCRLDGPSVGRFGLQVVVRACDALCFQSMEGCSTRLQSFFFFIFGLGGPLKCLSNWYTYLMCVDGVGNGVHKRQLQFPSQNKLRASEAMVRGDQVQASIPCHTMPYVPNTYGYHTIVWSTPICGNPSHCYAAGHRYIPQWWWGPQPLLLHWSVLIVNNVRPLWSVASDMQIKCNAVMMASWYVNLRI